MSRKLIWNGNELVFDNAPNVGVAGIAPEMPDSFGEQLAAAYNAMGDRPHDSDCAVHNEPAYPNGPCNCSLKLTAPRSASEETLERVRGWRGRWHSFLLDDMIMSLDAILDGGAK